MKSWALAGIVLTIGIGIAACSSDDNNGGTGSGGGGSGGTGSGSHAGPNSSSSHTASASGSMSTSSASMSGPTSSATGTPTSSSTGPGMTCDDIGVCSDDTPDQDPSNDCQSCAIIGDDVSTDSGICQDPYIACFGMTGDCMGDATVLACCGINMCINDCPTDPPDAQLDCICTNDGNTCTATQTDPNTCFGANPDGIEAFIGIIQCIFNDACPTSCM